MKLKTPIICPYKSVVIATQGFKPGIHEANDFVIWDYSMSVEANKRLTYGAKLVCPLKEAKVVWVEKWELEKDKVFSGIDGGQLQIEGLHEGQKLRLSYVHCSQVLVTEGQTVREGDVIALMGNMGDCRPLPTPEYPYDGTHLHFVVYTYPANLNGNGLRVDPQTYFDITQWYQGEDSSVTVDAQPLAWGIKKLGLTSIWDKVMYVLRVLGIV